MHPFDYGIELKADNIRKVKQYTSYYGNHYGPGKGFGNFNVSNDIRNGQFTRLSNDDFHLKQESNINDRRHILFKNYQDPKNLILPFPRGGEITRKSINKNKNLEKFDDEFKFKY